MRLVGCPILTVILVFEHAEITLVTTLSDVMVFEGLQDCTTGLMGMGTVRETTILGEMEDLTEITGQFLGFHIEGAKAFDARGINEPSLRLAQGLRSIQRDHLREGRRVLSGVVGIRDLGCPEVDTWNQAIDQGRLAYPTIATKKGDLQFVRGEKVGLVEDENYRNTIGLSRSQEPVDKGSRGLGIIDCDHQKSLIDISRNDMTLFGKIDTLTDDIVPTILNVCNKQR